MRSPRFRRRVVIAAVVVALTGCSLPTTHHVKPAAGPRTHFDRCAHSSQPEAYDGPLDWLVYGTETADRTWHAAITPSYVGDLSLMTTQTIVLDSVSLDPQDPRYFSPVRLEGAWVTTRPAMYEDAVTHWPTAKTTVACFVVHAQATADDVTAAPVLIVRLEGSAASQRGGRDWSANRGVVVHYHTLDGREFAAPFGLVNVYPNRPGVDTSKARPYLAQPVDD